MADELAGRRGKCGQCRQVVVVPRVVLSTEVPATLVEADDTVTAAVAETIVAAPSPIRSTEAPASLLAGGAPDVRPAESATPEAILNAFRGRIEPIPIPLTYRLGILLAAAGMILLPVIYLGVIGLVCYAIYWHAVNHTVMFSAVRGGRAILFVALLYVAPFVIGGILVLFMLKPIFSRPVQHSRRRSPTRKSEPLLFAFIDRLCDTVGAPRPKRVDINLDVNASASFRRGWLSFLGNDMVLTIGLPLVAGLTVRQFAGVLAHEFGHFAQGAGMRLTYVTRSISHWFTRVVYQRDELDEWLVNTAAETDIRISWILYLSMFFVWLTRKLLWCLMMVGHAISGYMLRQMEFSADRYEAQLAGSQTFAETARQLHVLGISEQLAQRDLGAFYREGRLADNFPRVMIAHSQKLPAEAVAFIEQRTTQGETSWFDTHPCDRDRIANAMREDAEGVFQLELPATVLLQDFEAQARQATLEMYRQVLGRQINSEDLQPVEALFGRQEAEQATQQALERYFQGGGTPLRPLALPLWEEAPPDDPRAAVARLKQLREQTLQRCKDHQRLAEKYDEIDTRAVQAKQASALWRAQLRMNARDMPEALRSKESAKSEWEQARAVLGQLGAKLRPAEEADAERLTLALRMLYVPQVARRIPTADDDLSEAEALLPVLRIVAAQLKVLWGMRDDFAAMVALLGALEGNEQNVSLVTGIKSGMETCQPQLARVQEALATYRYPFDHANKDITLAGYASQCAPMPDELATIYQCGDEVFDALPQLYIRTLAILSGIAERVEQAIGLSPLAVPEREEEPQPIPAGSVTNDSANRSPG